MKSICPSAPGDAMVLENEEIPLSPEPGFMWLQAVDAPALHYPIERSPSEKRPPAQTSSRGPIVNGTCKGRK